MRKINPLVFLFLFYLSTLIANKRLLNHARDHRNRMFNNNGTGTYTLAIAAIDPLIATYGSAIGDTRSTIQVQKGATLTKNGEKTAFSLFMHTEEVPLRYIFRTNPNALDEFIGNGMDEFNNITDENALPLMESIQTAAHNHSTDVGAAFVTAVDDFVTNYTLARDGQQQKFSTSDNARDLVKSTKSALIDLLIADHGIVIVNNSTSLVNAEEIFDYSLLYRKRSTNHFHFPPNGSITGVPNTVTNAGEVATDNATVVTIHNEGAGDIDVYFSATVNGLPGVNKKTVHGFSSATVNVMLIDGGDITKPYLNVFGANLTEIPIWRLDVHDEL
jgi:hypothetical protein